MKKIVLLTGVIVLLSLVRGAAAEEVAPDFTLTDIDGVQFSLSDYRGKAVILDFFATWCGPCVAEFSHLKSVHEEFGENVVIISISVSPSSDTVEKLQQFKQEHGIDWIVARDTAGVNDDYHVSLIPALVIIDEDGNIQHRHVGLTDESVLKEELYEILPEFGTVVSIMLVFSALTVAAIIYKRRLRKTAIP